MRRLLRVLAFLCLAQTAAADPGTVRMDLNRGWTLVDQPPQAKVLRATDRMPPTDVSSPGRRPLRTSSC